MGKIVDLRLGDCVKVMEEIPDGSVDVILTDPPYGYLKHKLDQPFDEPAYFDHVARVLKPNGFHVTFGRGTSFYGWNVQLADRGLEFKEEVVWNKKMPSTPGLKLLRFHETVSIYTKGKGKIRESVIPYIKMRGGDLAKIQEDLERISSALNSEKTFADLKEFIVSFEHDGRVPKPVYKEIQASKHGVTINKKFGRNDKNVGTLKPIAVGMRERSIIDITRDHYSEEHPTQKPVRLLERLLALVSEPGQMVLDPFMGSVSTGLAAWATGREFIGIEKLEEYYQLANRRIAKAVGCAKPEPLAWCV